MTTLALIAVIFLASLCASIAALGILARRVDRSAERRQREAFTGNMARDQRDDVGGAA